MTLKEYLAAENETIEAFASRVEASPGMIHKIVYRTRQPSLPLAVKIEAATGQKVGAFDMLLPIAVRPRVAADTAAAA